MKSNLLIIAVLFFVALQSCTTTRRFGTTIERDEKNPCQVNIVIQVAIEGTAEDVKTVRSALEACYNRQCFIPCTSDSSKGCMTKTTVVVKSYGELNEEERGAFHYVNMIDDDSLPSNAYIGTPNSGASSGTWRRNQPHGVYCHEVLHFCGLVDKYCARLMDPVTGAITTERNCDPPPDPMNGSCCGFFVNGHRCGTPCAGHENDLMGDCSVALTCENILDVLKVAGLDNCPVECCRSDKTFARPLPEFYITPGLLHFGDKNSKFGGIGASIGGTKYIGHSVGVSIDAGYFNHTEKENNFKESNGLLNISAGVSYRLPGARGEAKKPALSLHALAGICNWKQTITIGDNRFHTTERSLLLKLGGSLDLPLNRIWLLRLLQLDYAPTFFFDQAQHNYNIGVGLVYRPSNR